jgi:hypothetical protein
VIKITDSVELDRGSSGNIWRVWFGREPDLSAFTSADDDPGLLLGNHCE